MSKDLPLIAITATLSNVRPHEDGLELWFTDGEKEFLVTLRGSELKPATEDGPLARVPRADEFLVWTGAALGYDLGNLVFEQVA